LKDTNTVDSEIVELMLEKTKCDSSNRKKLVLTDEIAEKTYILRSIILWMDY